MYSVFLYIIAGLTIISIGALISFSQQFMYDMLASKAEKLTFYISVTMMLMLVLGIFVITNLTSKIIDLQVQVVNLQVYHQPKQDKVELIEKLKNKDDEAIQFVIKEYLEK